MTAVPSATGEPVTLAKRQDFECVDPALQPVVLAQQPGIRCRATGRIQQGVDRPIKQPASRCHVAQRQLALAVREEFL